MRANQPFSKKPLAAGLCFAMLGACLSGAAAGADDPPATAQGRLTITDNGKPLANQRVIVFAPGAGLAATRTTDANGQIRETLPLPPIPNSPVALAYPNGQRQRIDLPKDGSALLVASDRQGGIVALSPGEAARLAESTRPLQVGSNKTVGSGARIVQKAAETASGLMGGFMGGGSMGGGMMGGGGVMGGSSMLGGAAPSAPASRMKTDIDPIAKTAKRLYADLASGSEIEVGAQMTPKGLLVSAAVTKSPDDGTFQTIYLQDDQGQRAGPLEYYIYTLYQDWTLTVTWTYDRWVDGKHVEHREGGWKESGSIMLGNFLVPAEGDGIWRRMGFSNAVRGIKTIGVLFPVTAERLAQQPMHLVAHVTRPSQDPVTTTPYVISLTANTAVASAPLILLNTKPLLEGLKYAVNDPAGGAPGKETPPAGSAPPTATTTPQSTPPATPPTTTNTPTTTAGTGSGTTSTSNEPKAGEPPPKTATGTTEGGNPPGGGNNVASVVHSSTPASTTTTQTPPGGVCGPDITDKVFDVLDRMAADFRAATPQKREEACSALFGFSTYGGAWDIQPLDPGAAMPADSTPLLASYPYWFERYGRPAGCCMPRNPCGWTATFMGHCIHAQQVNYVQWGALNKLCGTEDKGRLAVILRGNVRFWNPTPGSIVGMQMIMSEVGAMYYQNAAIPALLGGAAVPMEVSQQTIDPATGRNRKNFFSAARPLVDGVTFALNNPEASCSIPCNLVEPMKSEFNALQFNYHWDILHPNRPGVANAR